MWLITGSSRGFGREWATAALERGDQVAAAARHPDDVGDLVRRFGDSIHPLELDVTDRRAAARAVRQAHARFGRLDVVVNNAGYLQYGMTEELTESQWRRSIDVDLLGAVWVVQAALPVLREQRAGRIIQVSSVSGLISAPTTAAYNAAKWALEGWSSALAGEVGGFGIKVTVVEPGDFATGIIDSSEAAEPMSAYESFWRGLRAHRERAASSRGAPGATATAVLRLVDMQDPPLRVLLGAGVLDAVEEEYFGRLREWTRFQSLMDLTQN